MEDEFDLDDKDYGFTDEEKEELTKLIDLQKAQGDMGALLTGEKPVGGK